MNTSDLPFNTRRHPRTLSEAFGPYTSRDFTEHDPMHTADKVVLAASAIAGVALLAMALLGWLQ
jgi:hypothetical protein